MSFKEQNELLRSAYQIAERNGEHTNWSAFKNNVQRELLIQSGVADAFYDDQTILRATCTARTYRVVMEGDEATNGLEQELHQLRNMVINYFDAMQSYSKFSYEQPANILHNAELELRKAVQLPKVNDE